MDFKSSPMSEKLRDAAESLVRLATVEKYVIVGVLFKSDPPLIVLLRNTSDDSAVLLHVAADMIEDKVRDGLVTDCPILPLN